MRISHKLGIFYLFGGYNTKAVLKRSGWKYHGNPEDCSNSTCKVCRAGLWKIWWTDNTALAEQWGKFLDDSAKHVIGAARAVIAESLAESADITVPIPAGLSYFPYQKAAIAFAAKRRGTLIADELGLGKSIEALGLINYDNTLQNVLIVCPASLRINWRREAEKWLTRKFEIAIVEENKAPPKTANLVICNYDRLVDRFGDKVLEGLEARSWDLMIVDEAHRLGNFEAKRTAGVTKLAEKVRKLVFLTGTPIPNQPKQLWPLLSALRAPGFTSFWDFATRYCNAHKVKWNQNGAVQWDLSGASNLEELQLRLRQSCMIRRVKAEVQKELPPKWRQLLVLPAEDLAVVKQEQLEFKQFEPELTSLRLRADLAKVSKSDEEFRKALSALQEKERTVFYRLSKTRQALALAKVSLVVDHIKELFGAGQTKVVIFAHHKEVIAKLAEHLSPHGVVTLTGDTPLSHRQIAIDRFQDPNSGIKVFIGSMYAAGEGITLTAASVAVFAELDWSPSSMLQAEDRLHRVTQTEKVLIQYLVFDGSLDARMGEVLVRKQEITYKALDPDVFTSGLEVPETLPETTGAQKSSAREAMAVLSNIFIAGTDKELAQELATRNQLTNGEVWLARKLAARYKGELPPPLLGALKLL